jgi:hypothetical protein
MNDRNNRKFFWTSLPGILTGMAAMITAIITLYTTFYVPSYYGNIPSTTPTTTLPTQTPIIAPTQTPIIAPTQTPIISESPIIFNKFYVFKEKGLVVECGFETDLFKYFKQCDGGGGYYAMVGQKVALNGNPEKTVNLILEDGEDIRDKKTLEIGETWNIGDWSLTVRLVDVEANPRPVWFILSYRGQELEEKVVNQGDVYTYIEKNIAGEDDVPMFVTFVDGIFETSTGGVAQFRYTWAISREIT